MKNIIYNLSKLFFYGFLIFAILLSFFSILSVLEYHNLIDLSFISIAQIGELNIDFLIIKIPIIELELQLLFGTILIFIVISLLYYSYYFYVLKEFFKLFTTTKVFNEKSTQKLKLFLKINLIAAIAFLVRFVFPILNEKLAADGEILIISIIHFTITLVLYYYLDLMKRGTNIQQENDLTI